MSRPPADNLVAVVRAERRCAASAGHRAPGSGHDPAPHALRPNGRAVVEAGKDYVLRLNNDPWLIQRFATEVLAHKPHIAETRDVLSNRVEVVRRLGLVRANRTSLTRGESAHTLNERC